MTSRPPPACSGAWHRLPWRPALACSLSVPSLIGCIDPEAGYEDFVRRPVALSDAAAPDAALTPCQELLLHDPSGSYFASCRPFTTMVPFGLAVQIAIASEGGARLTFSFRPLLNDATTLADGIGDVIALPETVIADDCTFVVSVGTLALPPTANPLMLDILAENVVVRGKLQSPDQACADLDGVITRPPVGITLEGDGDVCIFLRTPMDAPLPTVSEYVCDPTQLPARR